MAERAAVILHNGLNRMLRAYLARFATERGGLLVGFRQDDRLDVTAAVFPSQRTSARARCSFDTRLVDVVHRAIDTEPESILGWVHSHPRHGVYLSEQDIRTLSAWTGLDAEAVAMVVDPHVGTATGTATGSVPIGVWGEDAVRRELSGDGAASLDLAQARALLARLRVPPGERAALWDVVCADGVVSGIPEPDGADEHDDELADEPADEPGEQSP